MKVDNAIIMAAGTASRFAPLSYEVPKSLIEVRGEVLIERQIRQLQCAGIRDIIIVTGYKAEQFEYLKDKYNVILIHNPEYLTRNNNSSLYVVKEYIKNSYICSSDNYFINNPFEDKVDESFYSSVYVEGNTNEWCITTNDENVITDVQVGGCDTWVMLGHVFWSESFSKKFVHILENEYKIPETADKLWETIYIEHIDELLMNIKKYPNDYIFEFDTLDELRKFDNTYVDNTRSSIIKEICKQLRCNECDIEKLTVLKGKDNVAAGFTFMNNENKYNYYYETRELEEIKYE